MPSNCSQRIAATIRSLGIVSFIAALSISQTFQPADDDSQKRSRIRIAQTQ